MYKGSRRAFARLLVFNLNNWKLLGGCLNTRRFCFDCTFLKSFSDHGPVMVLS